MNYNELIVRYSQLYMGSWDSVVGMVTRLRTERSGLQILSEARDILFLQIVETGSEINPLSYSVCAGGAFRGDRAPGV